MRNCLLSNDPREKEEGETCVGNESYKSRLAAAVRDKINHLLRSRKMIIPTSFSSMVLFDL